MGICTFASVLLSSVLAGSVGIVAPAWTNHNNISGSQPMMTNFVAWATGVQAVAEHALPDDETALRGSVAFSNAVSAVGVSNAYTKAEMDVKLAEKIGGGDVPAFEQDPTVPAWAKSDNPPVTPSSTNPGYAKNADYARSAGTANTATRANSAGTADYAGRADEAAVADEAEFAKYATEATSAGSADNANHAATADNATVASHATTSEDSYAARKVEDSQYPGLSIAPIRNGANGSWVVKDTDHPNGFRLQPTDLSDYYTKAQADASAAEIANNSISTNSLTTNLTARLAEKRGMADLSFEHLSPKEAMTQVVFTVSSSLSLLSGDYAYSAREEAWLVDSGSSVRIVRLPSGEFWLTDDMEEVQSDHFSDVPFSGDLIHPALGAVKFTVRRKTNATLALTEQIPDVSGYQSKISDLESIRAGAAAGETAYQKPSGGIPNDDLADSVKESLGKADTALQSFTEQDPKWNAEKSDYIPWADTTKKAVTIGVRKSGSMIGSNSLAQGGNVTASGRYSHAEGYNTTASGANFGAHAEGNVTTASGDYGAHAEGNYTTASGNSSHAEGNHATASGFESHAEGMSTTASGKGSHAEGVRAIASHLTSFAWQGTDVDYNTTASNIPEYNSHGSGTFNLNPVGGLSGFWVGETNMAQHIANLAPQTDLSNYFTKSESSTNATAKVKAEILAQSLDRAVKTNEWGGADFAGSVSVGNGIDVSGSSYFYDGICVGRGSSVYDYELITISGDVQSPYGFTCIDASNHFQINCIWNDGEFYLHPLSGTETYYLPWSPNWGTDDSHDIAKISDITGGNDFSSNGYVPFADGNRSSVDLGTEGYLDAGDIYAYGEITIGSTPKLKIGYDSVTYTSVETSYYNFPWSELDPEHKDSHYTFAVVSQVEDATNGLVKSQKWPLSSVTNAQGHAVSAADVGALPSGVDVDLGEHSLTAEGEAGFTKQSPDEFRVGWGDYATVIFSSGIMSVNASSFGYDDFSVSFPYGKTGTLAVESWSSLRTMLADANTSTNADCQCIGSNLCSLMRSTASFSNEVRSVAAKMIRDAVNGIDTSGGTVTAEALFNALKHIGE